MFSPHSSHIGLLPDALRVTVTLVYPASAADTQPSIFLLKPQRPPVKTMPPHI